MRYAQIRKMDISNGEGIGVALFTQGCRRHCRNCHNPEQWSFDGGKEFTFKTQQQIIDLLKPSHISRLSILGGEPLERCNLYRLACLLSAVRYYRPQVKIWLYTGWTYEELQKQEQEDRVTGYLTSILDNIDYLVDGPFIEEEKDITLEFRGSSNQRILNMKSIRRFEKLLTSE